MTDNEHVDIFSSRIRELESKLAECRSSLSALKNDLSKSTNSDDVESRAELYRLCSELGTVGNEKWLSESAREALQLLTERLAACRPSAEAIEAAKLAVKLWTEADQHIRSRMMPKTMKRLADEILRIAGECSK